MISERFEFWATSRRDESLDLHAGLIAAFLDANFGFIPLRDICRSSTAHRLAITRF
jgi:hypothetical protein